MAAMNRTEMNPPAAFRTRVGSVCRRGRLELGWSQRQVAAAAGVSQALVRLVDAGRPGASLDSIKRIAAVLGIELVARPPLVVGAADQHDAAHSRCVSAIRHLLEREGQVCATEQPVADGRTRGWIDILAFDVPKRRLAVIEVKTVIGDAGALERQVDLYARTCLARARELGWRPTEVFVIVAALLTAETDAFVVANRDAMRHVFPARGRDAIATLLDGGPVRGRGIITVDPRRRGRRILSSLAADGRRTAAPYRDYAHFMACLRGGQPGRAGGARQAAPARQATPAWRP